ncbi:MAG TPA: hypothetical protein VM553_18435 [Dongiaceae bacterium]|nr:hypothetical protein [Dongiaceae bacterium]
MKYQLLSKCGLSKYQRLPAGVALLALLIAGCGEQEEKQEPSADSDVAEESSAADGQEAILLHARVDYTFTSQTAEIGGSQAHISLHIRQPAFRSGKGESASYDWDNDHPVEVTGAVRGEGSAAIVSNDTTLNERYDKSLSLPQWKAPEQGAFSITMPEPSSMGDGLSMQVNIHAPVSGTQTVIVSGQDMSASMAPNFARPLLCTGQQQYIQDGSDGCGIEIRLEPTPTSAKNDIGQVMLPQVQKALAAPNGEVVMAMLGQVYGATTEYRSGGHFVTRFVRKYEFAKDQSQMTYDYQVTVWSTAKSEDWTPSDVTPPKSL